MLNDLNICRCRFAGFYWDHESKLRTIGNLEALNVRFVLVCDSSEVHIHNPSRDDRTQDFQSLA